VCWQIPLFFESDDSKRTTTVRATRTADWGEEGILDWWCTEHEEAFGGEDPLYVTMEAELRRVCGDEIYEELAEYCRKRGRGLKLLPMAR
jgi:hypothetical protein